MPNFYVPTIQNLTQLAGTNLVTGGVAGSLGVGGLAAAGAAPSGNPLAIAGWDGANVRLPKIFSTGTAVTCASTERGPSTLHRSAVTAVDKLGTPGTLTLSGTTGGSLTSGTTYNVGAAAGNVYGTTTVSSIASAAPGASNTVLRVAVPQSTGPNSAVASWYDIFLSTDAAPKWVGRITETQRAAGCVITAVGTVGAGSVAGSVDVQVVGTGAQTSAADFANNNAYVPDASGLTAYTGGVGYSGLEIVQQVTVTDLRSTTVPSLVCTMWSYDSGTAVWSQDASLTFTGPLSAARTPFIQRVAVNHRGNGQIVVLIDTLATAVQGVAVNISITPFR